MPKSTGRPSFWGEGLKTDNLVPTALARTVVGAFIGWRASWTGWLECPAGPCPPTREDRTELKAGTDSTARSTNSMCAATPP